MEGVTNGVFGMAQAAMVSEGEIKQVAAQSAQQMDAENQVAPAGSPYDARLQNIARYINVPGQTFHFKAYITNDLNAFALPNGEVRVYSGLMDQMTDQELLFILGHEVGHVVKGHSLREMQLAYATAGLRQIASSQTGQLGQIAAGDLGAIGEKFIGAQFSQSQEQQSDDYGAQILKNYQLSPQVGASALRKLKQASDQSGGIDQLFSSHPDPESRARRLEGGEA